MVHIVSLRAVVVQRLDQCPKGEGANQLLRSLTGAYRELGLALSCRGTSEPCDNAHGHEVLSLQT